MSRLGRLFRLATGRSTSDADADAELALHLELRTEELIATGHSPADARKLALAALGDRGRIRRELVVIDAGTERAGRRRELLQTIGREMRLGIRSLAADRWFTAGAGLIIVLAGGLNAVIFSALNTAFLRPLPYPAADEIVRIYETSADGEPMQVAAPNAVDWRRLSKSIRALAVFGDADVALVDGDEPEYVHAAAVGLELLQVLGVNPILGRWMAPEEAVPGAPIVAVIGEGLWRRRYAGLPNVLGRTVKIAGLSTTIVGVLPRSVTYPNGTDIWISAERTGLDRERTAHNWQVVARLAPGVGRRAAEADLTNLTRQLMAGYRAADQFAARGASVVSLRDSQLGSQRSLLLLVQGAAVILLLIAAVNLTNLLLVRGIRHRTEIAVRSALGARQADLVRRFVLEATILTTAAGSLGVLLALPARDALHRLLVRFVPQLPPPVVDVRVLLVCLVGSALIGALASAIPAARAAREDPNRVLGGSGAARITGRHPLMNGLIAIEIALALILLAGAGLMTKSLLQLGRVTAGFDPANRVVVRVPSDFASDDDDTPPAVTVGRIDRLLGAVRATAGVRTAGITIAVPLEDRGSNATVDIAGVSVGQGEHPSANFRIVSPGYFTAIGMPLFAGRDFEPTDDLGSPWSVVVNRAFADRYLAGRETLGRRLRFSGMQQREEPWATVVGVVGDVRHRSLDQPPEPEVYYTYRQRAPTARSFSVVVAARRDPAALLVDLKPVFAREAPSMPFRAFSLESTMTELLGAPRMRSSVLLLFAGLAMALAAAGIFGVVAFTVAQRTREIGLRLALGSGRGAATRSAMRLVITPVVGGLAAGVAGALAVGRLVKSFLFDTGPEDPMVLGLALGAMLAVSLAASYWPARRAARIEPIIALRDG
jgi:putative ABC transport system permease protein